MPKHSFVYLGLILGLFSCKSEFEESFDEGANSKSEKIEKAPNVPVTPSSEFIPPPTTNAAKPLNPGQGYSPGDRTHGNFGTEYKGGSQGFREEVDTGNIDEPLKHKGPNGKCGNGEPEVYSQKNAQCPHLIYGIVNDDDTSKLYSISKDSGQGNFIANISGLNNISGIDFDPQGNLYAIGRINNNDWRLAKIDCITGTATILGDPNIGITNSDCQGFWDDISFDTYGNLWALNTDRELCKIRVTDAKHKKVGDTGIVEPGLSLFSSPLINFDIFAAGQNLYELKKSDASTIDNGSLLFVSQDSSYLTDADNDLFTGKTYAVEATADKTYVAVLDGMLNVTRLGNDEFDDLEAIAVNRVHEECDGYRTPEGTICENCELKEHDCKDSTEPDIAVDDLDFGADNDGDLNEDCYDEDCLSLPCNDENGCTENDVCVSSNGGECKGTDVVCPDNECAIITCISLGDDAHDCDYRLDDEKEDWGDCGSSDGCTLGKCVEIDETPTCQTASKNLISTDDGGCLDNNVCTADSCYDGDCLYESLEGMVCSVDGFEGICKIADTLDFSKEITCELPKLKVFVTSQTYNGAMQQPTLSVKTLANADEICNDLAANAGLSGEYVAWLSSSTANAIDRLGGANIPNSWYLVDGTTLVANGAAQLISGTLSNAISKNESNVNVGSQRVWTGTGSNGNTNSNFHCNNWSLNTGGVGSYGLSDSTSSTWTVNIVLDTCDSERRLYCFQKP